MKTIKDKENGGLKGAVRQYVGNQLANLREVFTLENMAAPAFQLIQGALRIGRLVRSDEADGSDSSIVRPRLKRCRARAPWQHGSLTVCVRARAQLPWAGL